MISPATYRRTFSGAGRPPRKNVARYPGGQVRHAQRVERGEKEQDVLRTALDARVRQFGVKLEDARSHHLGSAMGRLLLVGDITPTQHAAGVRFARVMSLQGILDDVRPAYGIPVLARLSCASGSDPYDRFDPDQAWDATDERRRLEIIRQIRQDAADATSALWEMEAMHRGAAYLVDRLCCWDDITVLGPESRIGALRCGLNALVRVWKLDVARAV